MRKGTNLRLVPYRILGQGNNPNATLTSPEPIDFLP